MLRHIFPNLVHLMLIVTVLEFSALVLYEVVLSYVGVGVDPSMNSFGGMINLARSDMSRDPMGCSGRSIRELHKDECGPSPV